MTLLAAALLGFLLADPPDTGRSRADLSGDYAGWLYLSGGGDAPLRLHVRKTSDEAESLEVMLDSPAEKVFGLPTREVERTAEGLRFERVDPSGSLLEYRLRERDGVLSGEVHLDGAPFASLDLVRSDEKLEPVPTHWFEDCVGAYRADDGATLWVSAWFWGDLRILELDTGIERTLFALDDSRFFAGPAQYVPSPIAFRIEFERDADEEVVALTRIEGTSSKRYARRPIRSEPFEFSSGGSTLHGTLTLPDGDGPFPAIVVLGGSGWTTRRSVERDAIAFHALGLATLSYDQRGYGESVDPAMPSSSDPVVAFDRTADDAAAALSALQNDSRIDRTKVGLAGRSRGGWFAPLAIARGAQAAFLVLFVAPAISPAQQERTRRMNEFRAAGASEAELRQAEEYLDALFQRSRSDAAWERYAALRARLADERIDGRFWLDILLGGDSRDSSEYRWESMNMHYDPIPALERVPCPVLALFGELDDNVVPADNAPIMRAALERGGNRSVTIHIVPDGNHGLAPSRGARLPIHRFVGSCPEVWGSVSEWLRPLVDEK